MPPSDGAGAGAAGRSGDMTYTAAAAELDAILGELDDDRLDVDGLATRVRRAAELIRFCRGRITSARMEVEQIVADLDQTDEPTQVGPATDAPG